MRKSSELVIAVTGASRGIGRGIAESMGELGATVYVTGRSVPGSSTENLPQTIQQTAELVTSRGGKESPSSATTQMTLKYRESLKRLRRNRDIWMC